MSNVDQSILGHGPHEQDQTSIFLSKLLDAMADQVSIDKRFKLEYFHEFRGYMKDALDAYGVHANCYHCGTSCSGLCSNKDRCYTCFVYDKRRNTVIDHEVYWPIQLDDCLDEECTCTCHMLIQKTHNNKMLSRDGKQWVPIGQKGSEKIESFRFMDLPVEMRNMVYKYLFLPEIPDKRVRSTYHMGAIHKSILLVNRQIYEEAKLLPLKMNKLSFQAPFHGVDFFSLPLQPVFLALITTITVEMNARDACFDQSDFPELCYALQNSHVERLNVLVRGRLRDRHLKPRRFLARDVFSALEVISTLKKIRVKFTTETLSDEAKRKFAKRLCRKYEHRDGDADEGENQQVDPRDERDFDEEYSSHSSDSTESGDGDDEEEW
ncbi:MAG: hypothetical protein Q9191_007475 [Dirinaria sp. TL-2023a]